MTHPFMVGKNLYLRGLEKSDLEGDYFQWLNDQDVTKYLDSGNFPNTIENMEEFYRNTALSGNNVIFAIVDLESDKHIGNIKLGPINWISRISPVGIMIGDKTYWGKNYGTESLELVLNHAFNKLNLHKITLGVVAKHDAATKAYEKAGFKIEGRAKSQFYLDGEYFDTVYMGILREEFMSRDE